MSAVRAADAQRGRIGRIAGVAGAAVAAAALTAGCAAGQVAQTADQRPSLDGTNAKIGAIDLRAVAIESPPNQQTTYRSGGAALLNLVLVNNGKTADQLVDARGSAVRGWGVYDSAADAFNVVLAANGLAPASLTPSSSGSAPGSAPGSASASGSTGSPSDSGTPTGSESASSSDGSTSTGSTSAGATSSASTSASSSPRATASSLPKGVQSVTIPAGGRVGFGTPEATGAVVLTGITKTLRPAQTVNISFTFARAGTVTVPVSVQVADLGRTASVPAVGEG